MFTKTIAYKDLNGADRTKECHFHFFESEILEMEMSEMGGFAEMVQRMIDAQDHPSLVKVIKEFLLKAYGIKSPDGDQFIKSEEISNKFSQTGAFSALFMELTTNEVKAAEFVNALIPESMRKNIAENLKKKDSDNTPVLTPVN